MAATATATANPPGYFVGRPLHYQDPQPQTVPPPQQEPEPQPPAAPAVDDQNAVNAQVPGYYKGRVQPRRGEDAEHSTNGNAGGAAADQQNREQGFFAKWFGCFSGTS